MQTFFKEFVILINIIYWLPMFISIAITIVAVWLLGKRFKVKKIYRVIVSVLLAYLVSLYWYIPVKKAEEEKIAKYNEQKEKYEEARAVFDEQCKKAGEKIYRTVDNVDGVMLLKSRRREDLEEHEKDKSIWALHADPTYSHAAIDRVELRYILSFLGYSGQNYSFVDVLEKDGSISRYKYNKVKKDEEIVEKNPLNPARYAVTYENNIDPELRKHWVAGVTIKIIDRQTDELLAEKTIFAFESGLGSTATSRVPWMHYPEHCPELLQRSEENYPTFRFVATVLKL